MMNKMLHILVAVLSLLIAWPAAAHKERVVEASAKHKPDWIGCSTAETIAVTEVGDDLNELAERAMASIRQHIIQSVAVSVSSTEVMRTHQISEQNLIVVMNDYESVLMTQAAQLPFLNNLTLSNAEAIYWERIYNKQQKSYRYEYSVRYPFSAEQRQDLVNAFLAIDNAKMEQMQQLREELKTLTDLDRISRALIELDGLEAYFFDAIRREEVDVLRRSFRSLYKEISIQVEYEEAGLCRYTLRLQGRPVTTSIKPRLKSESAIELSVQAEGEGYTLHYNPQYASKRDLNTIEILYPFGGVRVERVIYFTPATN